MLINLTNHPNITLEPEERDFWGVFELDEIDQPLSRDEAFRVIEGRIFEAVWPSDEFPW
jgi:hypothetical protein